MKVSFTRYTPTMLASLGKQSLLSLIVNALTRGIVFTAMIQTITLLSGLKLSSVVQMIVLTMIFSTAVFSFDVIEKYWAQNRLSRRTRS